jgi:hypothetical protein
VRRGAALALWSDPDHWEPIVRVTGLDVCREQRADGTEGRPFVRLDETSQPLLQNRLIRWGHGRKGTSVYSRWSPFVHHDPRATFRRSSYRAEPSQGRFLGSIRREDEHLEMAAQVAVYIGSAAEQQGAYFGRDVSGVVIEVEKVSRLVGEGLPIVRAQIDARPTYPFGT